MFLSTLLKHELKSSKYKNNHEPCVSFSRKWLKNLQCISFGGRNFVFSICNYWIKHLIFVAYCRSLDFFSTQGGGACNVILCHCNHIFATNVVWMHWSVLELTQTDSQQQCCWQNIWRHPNIDEHSSHPSLTAGNEAVVTPNISLFHSESFLLYVTCYLYIPVVITYIEWQTNRKQFKCAEHLNRFHQFQPSVGGVSPANNSICMKQVARADCDLMYIRLCGGAPAVTGMKWSSQAWKEDTGQWARTVSTAKWTQQWFIPRSVMGMIWAFPPKQNSEWKIKHTVTITSNMVIITDLLYLFCIIPLYLYLTLYSSKC